MLAANVCAANFLAEHKHASLYRVHEGPSERKLENLRRFLGEHGLSLGGGDEPQASDYAALMEQVKTRPDVDLMQTMLLRSMQQAVYSPEQLGHFGLAYDAYAHFTSPIRRYPDLLVHRSIKAVLKGQTYAPGKWEEIGAHCSSTERRADEATRDVQNWLKCYFMRDRIGEVYEGVISAVTSFGVFVLLDGLFVEGLLHISELGKDYFHYDEAKHVLRGEHGGQVYGLTDRIRIRVARVDLETSKIDFALAQAPAEQAASKATRAGRAGTNKTVASAPAAAPAPMPAKTPPADMPASKPARGARRSKADAPIADAPAPAAPTKSAPKARVKQLAPTAAAEPDDQPDSPRLAKRPAQVAALLSPKPQSSPLDVVLAQLDAPKTKTKAKPAAEKTAAPAKRSKAPAKLLSAESGADKLPAPKPAKAKPGKRSN